MKHKDANIDEILERYFPPFSDSDVTVARDRFLLRLRERHELQQVLDNFRTVEPMTNSKFVSLGHVDQLVLTAAYLLRGEGSSLSIIDKVNALTLKKFDTGTVFVSLDRLERGRLILARPADPPPKDRKPKLLFTVTAEGERMLREVRAGAKRLMDALQDFA
jgi:DNA-binding PadR family transcriptional regulator